jgi:hypothetical protein
MKKPPLRKFKRRNKTTRKEENIIRFYPIDEKFRRRNKITRNKSGENTTQEEITNKEENIIRSYTIIIRSYTIDEEDTEDEETTGADPDTIRFPTICYTTCAGCPTSRY